MQFKIARRFDAVESRQYPLMPSDLVVILTVVVVYLLVFDIN